MNWVLILTKPIQHTQKTKQINQEYVNKRHSKANDWVVPESKDSALAAKELLDVEMDVDVFAHHDLICQFMKRYKQ